jgi:hypothetical protein
MFCHGELVRLKPAPAYLTRFYLMVSLGGAVGSAVVGIRRAARAPGGLRAQRRARAVRAASAVADAREPKVYPALATLAVASTVGCASGA